MKTEEEVKENLEENLETLKTTRAIDYQTGWTNALKWVLEKEVE